MLIFVTVTQLIEMPNQPPPGTVVAAFKMNDANSTERKNLAIQIKAAHRAGQAVNSAACLKWRKS